jgi:hypothetical protein
MEFAGTAQSAQGTLAPLSSHFQLGSCRSLTFKPNFQVETSARTSRSDGASLTAKILYPPGKLGANQASSQSNVAYVKVELPKQLPSRLTTLQKACTQVVFQANQANCPAASRVGEASAVTPVLPVPLKGPAYFVSNGGTKFPELIISLSGYGDVPIYAFELKLPEGPYSALAANGNLCASKLVMPTTFVGHNGAEIRQATPITVSGCKPQIRVIRHRVSGKTATLLVGVPSAGTLRAGGNGLSKVTRLVRTARTVEVTLRLSKQEQRFVARHHNRRLMAPIGLSFTPNRGERMTAQVAVLMR